MPDTSGAARSAKTPLCALRAKRGGPAETAIRGAVLPSPYLEENDHDFSGGSMSDTAWLESRKALLACTLRMLSGVRCLWHRPPPERQAIYYANHTSHLDALLIWACLPDAARRRARPVAASDYWRRKGLREYLATDVFNVVFVERAGGFNRANAQQTLAPLHAALDHGDSLILFPEGTRNRSEARLLPFKSGLYRITRDYPHVALVPVWLENLNRMLPKGAWLPLPLLCSLIMGEDLPAVRTDESRRDFLQRAEAALLALSPSLEPSSK